MFPFLRKQRFKAAKPYLKNCVLDVEACTGGLADFVNYENYIGIEVDQYSLSVAKTCYPEHQFESSFHKHLVNLTRWFLLP